MFNLSKLIIPFAVIRASSAFNIMGRTTRSSARAVSSGNREGPIATKKTVAKKKAGPVKKADVKEPTVARTTKAAAVSNGSVVITIEACKQ